MNRFLFVGALALVLPGAAQVAALQAGAGFSYTQATLDGFRSGYDGAFLTPAARYRALGYCATGTTATLAKPSANRAVVAKLQATDAALAADFVSAQAALTSGNASGLPAAFNAVQTAISNAESLAATYGVK